MIDVFQYLKEEFQNEDKTFTPAFIEEYVVEGELDYRYIAKKFKLRLTKAEARKACEQQFQTISFISSRQYENEVTEKEFKAHYEFGKFPDARGWITYFEKATGEVLTREVCYKYLLKRTQTSN